jgi:CelD/BcsL family acetyltransferase involved in cellulose biosynthesis
MSLRPRGILFALLPIMTISVEFVTSWNDLLRLEQPWNALAGGMPLRSWDWLAIWWKHYGSVARRDADHSNDQPTERKLRVLAVYRDALNTPSGEKGCRKLVGIAPWFLDRTIVKGNVLRWLGSGEVCTDHLSLVCESQNREEVAVAVAEALTTSCDDWDRLELNAVDADDPTVGLLTSALEDRGCLVSRYAADAYWALELPASWDDYLATLSKSHRKQLRRLEREVLESDRVCWHRVRSEEALADCWEVLVDLHQRRRRSLGEPGCFASRMFHDFHREVVGRLLARDQLRMSWLKLDGSPAAAEYHFTDGTTTYAYQGGVDPERLGAEPGRLSTISCLQAAINEGQRCVDFMRGDEPYKAHWRARSHPTYDYRVVPNRRFARLRGRLLAWSDSAIDWMRETVCQPNS